MPSQAQLINSPLVITIVTRGDDLEHHVPVGFHMVDQVFDEAGLRDPISASHTKTLAKRLRIIQRALSHEFEGRIMIRLVNPWTPAGLWFVVRHRLRHFPCILIGGECYPVESQVSDLIESVRLALGTETSPPSSQN